MKTRLVIAFPLMLSLMSACIVVDPDPDPCLDGSCGNVVYTSTGNMGFYWSFELADGDITGSCDLAEVAGVDIRVYNAWGDLEFVALNRPCSDLGADITRFETGDYTLELTARCDTGLITHEALYDVSVYSGSNEFGDLILSFLGPCY